MSLDRLETFRILVETGSFTETASRLFITQPAVSQQLKILQEEVGKRLYQKQSNRIQLTPEGQALYQQIVGPLKELTKSINEAKQGKQKAVFHLMGPYAFFGKKLFEKLPKNADWQLHFGNSDETNRCLLEGSIDIAFMSTPHKNNALKFDVVHREEMILVGTERAFRESLLSIADINGDLVSKWCLENGETLSYTVKSIIPNIFCLIDFLKAQDVCGVVPSYLVRDELREKTLVKYGKTPSRFINDVSMGVLKKRYEEIETVRNLYDRLFARF